MKRKLIAILGFLIVLIFAIPNRLFAAGGQYTFYLPIIASKDPTWQEVGAGSASGEGISHNAGSSILPSLAITSDGVPYVAWQDNSDGDDEIYVRKWTGTAWTEVGTGSASGGGISNNAGYSAAPSLAIAPDGTLYIAWDDKSGGDAEIYVRAWNGNTWDEVGTGSATGSGISNNNGYSSTPSIAIASDGTPYIAWFDNSNGRGEIYVRGWNGNSWAEVGQGSASGGGISNTLWGAFDPSLAIAPDGTLYLAWADSSNGKAEIYIRAWNGSQWVEVGMSSASGGGISNTGGDSNSPSLAVDVEGTPTVAWADNSSGTEEIYVRTWNGSHWVEIGAGSAEGGGISDSGGISLRPSLAIASDATPYISWEFNSTVWSTNEEIYIRNWNGTYWEETGLNVASSGGISNNPGGSWLPSLAIGQDNIPYVAWSDSDPENTTEIYILRYIK